jgi:hypothetical protein
MEPTFTSKRKLREAIQIDKEQARDKMHETIQGHDRAARDGTPQGSGARMRSPRRPRA